MPRQKQNTPKRKFTPKELETLLDIKTVMKRLGVRSRQTVYTLMEQKGLPSHKVGSQRRFVPSEVAEWVQKREEQKLA